MKTRAVVASVGARTPVGLTAQASAYLYRAAHVVMQQSPILDANEELATMAVLPTLDPRMTGGERLVALARPALDEAMAPVFQSGGELRTKLVLCIDEFAAVAQGHAGIAAYGLTTELTRAMNRYGGAVDVDTAARGPASLGYALESIVGEIERGSIDAAVVGGVHSDYDANRIVALSQSGRLFHPDQLDAIIPGEAAAFVVLMSEQTARRNRLAPLLQLHSFATAFSNCRPDNDESAFEAAGLTAATRKAAEPMSELGLQCGWQLTDLSFETMRLYEFQAMPTRTHKLWCRPQYCDAPAHRLGYLGAAAMPLHMVLAAEAWRGGFAPHSLAMSFAGSDAGGPLRARAA